MAKSISIAVMTVIALSCSDNPITGLDHNVTVICRLPDGPLMNIVTVAGIRVSAPDLPKGNDLHMPVNMDLSTSLSVDIMVPPGPQRAFRAYLEDNVGGIYFTSRQIDDVFSDRIQTLVMNFNQSGFGLGNSAIIFRDDYPWDSRALDSVLIQAGLTSGDGPGQYLVYPSMAMPFARMRPGSDIVIISSDQPQTFYDNYAVGQDNFERFIRDGGGMLWCACDMGWNYGSIQDSGLELPGSIDINYSLDQTNIPAADGFEILDGFSNILTGNYASQETFESLPVEAIVYLTDSHGLPTLIGYGMGDGWVIVSGQPLEYNFDRRDQYNIGELLPRLIRFLLGIGTEEFLSLLPGVKTLKSESRTFMIRSEFASEGAPRQ